MAQEAVATLSQKLSVTFPEDELGRTAIHFINAKREGEVTPSFQISRTKHILELVKQELSRDNIERTPQ